MRTETGFRVWLIPLFGALASCGGGGGGGAGPPVNGGDGWHVGCVPAAHQFRRHVRQSAPGHPGSQRNRTDENNWLRSWTNELYLWYGEVTDRNPANYDTETYFDLLKTDAITDSGQPKDKFHFTYDTDDWIALSQGGTEAGYGAEFAILATLPAAPHRGGVHRARIHRRDATWRAATKSCR